MAKTLLVGIDYSITSPGVVVFETNEHFERVSVNFLGFTEVKKNSDCQEEFAHYKKDKFTSEEERFDWMSTQVISFVEQFVSTDVIVYVAIEGYAMGAKGLIFNIAEATGLLKHKLWKSGYNIRIYEPTTVKKFSTGKGNSDKVYMGDAFIRSEDSFKPILSDYLRDYESPKADIIDAYWIAYLLYNEMLLRLGKRVVEDYPIDMSSVFTTTSKSHKKPLLQRDFIKTLRGPTENIKFNTCKYTENSQT